MHELTKRILALYRDDPTLAFTCDPFRLYTAGLRCEDIGDERVHHLPFALKCAEEARVLFREEVDRDAQAIRQA